MADRCLVSGFFLLGDLAFRVALTRTELARAVSVGDGIDIEHVEWLYVSFSVVAERMRIRLGWIC
jgi:hypothetical protein